MSEIKQNSSENIDFELDTMGLIIYWKQWSGKTTIWLEIAVETWGARIYSNFSIFRNEKSINRYIWGIPDILKIRYSKTPGVIVIDEAGINANSKDWRSKDSRALIDTLFLARKYNCSFIWISQRFESIDINARVLSDLILKMRKIRRGHWLAPTFEVTREKQRGAKLELVNIHRIDTIALMKYDKLTYNTLETSRFATGEKVKIKRKKSNEEWIEGKILRVDITT